MVALLAADESGQSRESTTADVADLAPYRRAFTGINADPAQPLGIANEAPGRPMRPVLDREGR